MHQRLIVFSTPRLVLREMSADDAPFILELLNDPAFIRHIGDKGVRTLDAARDYIRTGPVASYKEHGFGLWLAERRDDSTRIGICGLLKRAVLDDVDIGFALLPQFRSGGYGFEAASAVIAHARDILGLRRLVAISNSDNYASGKLLEKLGLSFEKLVQPFPDQPPLRLYSVDFPVTP
jgi:ribosomal-protein-alanine N-acetyltransferase